VFVRREIFTLSPNSTLLYYSHTLHLPVQERKFSMRPKCAGSLFVQNAACSTKMFLKSLRNPNHISVDGISKTEKGEAHNLNLARHKCVTRLKKA
jgi:hypothetical protein